MVGKDCIKSRMSPKDMSHESSAVDTNKLFPFSIFAKNNWRDKYKNDILFCQQHITFEVKLDYNSNVYMLITLFAC